MFLSKPPYKNKKTLLDNFTALVFLLALSGSLFRFTQTMKSEITINGQKFTHHINILET